MTTLPSRSLRCALSYNFDQGRSIRDHPALSGPRSNRDLGFDGIVVSAHAAVCGIEKPGGCQGLDIRVDIAVVAAERLRERANTGDFVPAHVAQQLHPLTCQYAGKRIPAFERQMALMEGLAVL